jgi:hypothetical protein
MRHSIGFDTLNGIFLINNNKAVYLFGEEAQHHADILKGWNKTSHRFGFSERE